VQVDEITIPSPDFPDGQTFGPVTLAVERDVVRDSRFEVPVTFAARRRRVFGVDWYPHLYHARGVFSVVGDEITLALTEAPIRIEPAAWWRRLGYWLLGRPAPSGRGAADPRSRLPSR
jgi:hypothetical protein